MPVVSFTPPSLVRYKKDASSPTGLSPEPDPTILRERKKSLLLAGNQNMYSRTPLIQTPVIRIGVWPLGKISREVNKTNLS
jgi:hypothetical protein